MFLQRIRVVKCVCVIRLFSMCGEEFFVKFFPVTFISSLSIQVFFFDNRHEFESCDFPCCGERFYVRVSRVLECVSYEKNRDGSKKVRLDAATEGNVLQVLRRREGAERSRSHRRRVRWA